MRKADHADGGREQKKQPAGGFRAVESQRQPGQRKRGKQRGDGARQARRGFAHPKELEAQRSAPVEERRLFKPWLSVQTRRDPVAGFGHVARDPGVARLVRPDEADGAEMAEVADVERRKNKDGPADFGSRAGGPPPPPSTSFLPHRPP